jgi:hypothetical protein
MFLCTLACLLSTAAVTGVEQAGAKPRFEVKERSLRLSARVEASNGYEGWISTEGHKRVTLTLVKGRTEIEARTSGRVTRHGISASFGDLGRISVRFRGRPIDLGLGGGNGGDRRCRGREPVFEDGFFTGRIRFRDENGFARLNSKRATGFVERRYRRVCRQEPKKDDSLGDLFESLFGGVRLTVLRASARVERANVVFEATAVDFSSLFGPGTGLEYLFSGQTVERGKGMRLTRSIGAEGGDGSFLFRNKKALPRTATVTPPKPFSGTAKYIREPGHPSSWIGSLDGRVPGVGLVAMAGPDFRASTCRTNLTDLLEGRCMPGSGQALSRSLSRLSQDLAYGSGSQSQLLGDARLSWSR